MRKSSSEPTHVTSLYQKNINAFLKNSWNQSLEGTIGDTFLPPKSHKHFHRVRIPLDATKFNYHSGIKVIRSTMYEPVMDRCVTTTIIKPIKSPNDDSSTNEYMDRKDLSPPEKPPRRHSKAQRQLAHRESCEAVVPNKMRPSNGDTCLNVDHINLENKYKSQRVEASVQTSHLVPYRLRFWPGTNCDVKLSPSETNCALRAKCCCRIISQWVLSQVGLTIVVVIWALLGAFAFFNTEGPRELEQSNTLAKIQKDLSVELATDLKDTVEHQEKWPSTIHKYFERHESLFLDAVGAGFGEGGGGNIWTYPGCILFAVSLLTTLGFGAPVPRTSLGRGAAVIFALIGIPLHFLLILNMGNLAALKLQRLAIRNSPTDIPSIPTPRWLKLFPFLAIIIYYLLGVVLFGFVRDRDPASSFMFPLDFTAAGGVATVDGEIRIFYALYLEMAVTLAAIVVSLLQASATRGIVDVGLNLGLLTNT